MKAVLSRNRRSNAWLFVAISSVLLVLFVMNGILFDGGTNVHALNAQTFGLVMSFLFAAGALGAAIAANASAYLNPASSMAARVLTPPLILAVSVIVLPFFITVGLSMVG